MDQWPALTVSIVRVSCSTASPGVLLVVREVQVVVAVVLSQLLLFGGDWVLPLLLLLLLLQPM